LQPFFSFRFLSSFSSTCIVISICKCLSHFIYPIYASIVPFYRFFYCYVLFCVTLSAFSTLIIRRLIAKQILNNVYFVFFIFRCRKNISNLIVFPATTFPSNQPKHSFYLKTVFSVIPALALYQPSCRHCFHRAIFFAFVPLR
jgi:hypothetical protein